MNLLWVLASANENLSSKMLICCYIYLKCIHEVRMLKINWFTKTCIDKCIRWEKKPIYDSVLDFTKFLMVFMKLFYSMTVFSSSLVFIFYHS